MKDFDVDALTLTDLSPYEDIPAGTIAEDRRCWICRQPLGPRDRKVHAGQCAHTRELQLQRERRRRRRR